MSAVARERLAVLLGQTVGHGAFSASRTAPSEDLRIEVRGVGVLELPISRAQAQALHRIGRPARYGVGELTLLDPAVRDTCEIPKSRVRIDKRRFNRTLLPILDRIGRDLGVPAGCTLGAELHSMLVYGRGQFFAPHQDSEKHDAMVGTLVVGLPSTFTGGTFVVSHGGESASYRGSKTKSSFVAFYADCRHEAHRVTSGHRVVLTYNLLLRGEPVAATELDPALVVDLAECLADHFGPDDEPNRLVYMLDHEYTQRSLGWARLKGNDGQRAALLAAAAERAGCEAVLALADVHETWTAFADDEDRYSGYRGRYGWHGDDEEWDDDLDAAGGTGDYDLEELMESEVELDSWLAPGSDRVEPVQLAIADDCVCASTPPGELEAYRSEYEGNMGNYGNTLDRWYHRGAVIVWPRGQAFAVRAEASPVWALDELSRRIRGGGLDEAREAVPTLAPFWARVGRPVEGKSFVANALRTARLIDSPELATVLLAPFGLEQLATSHAMGLASLADRYGESWAQAQLSGWSQRRGFAPAISSARQVWVTSLPALCAALNARGAAGGLVARLLLWEGWRCVSQAIDADLKLEAPSRREQALTDLGRPLAALLEGASEVGVTDLRDGAVGMLCRQALHYCALGVLRTTERSKWSDVGLKPVASHAAACLENRLTRPARVPDDWSIELPEGCDCELCSSLRVFLGDPARKTLEWPLAKERRRHVHTRIDAAELPVTHQTRRVGSPHKLVLTKTRALFDREGEQRKRETRDLAWLRARAPQ
jgi:hypothetical protein